MTSLPASAEPKIFRVGTLRYNRNQLFVLFFWLMWNDFSIMLIEQLTSLTNVLFRDHGATNTEIAIFGSLGGFISMWVNPWFSTWSDRLRSRHGRRRPFLLIATPFFAFFLMTIPFMPGLYHRIALHPAVVLVMSHLPIDGVVLFIGVASFVAGFFNAMVLAIFSYLYWDVVPGEVMGRFSSLSKIVTALAGFVWSFFLFGLGQHHMKALFVWVSVFCLAVYLLSVWRIKEGESPPPQASEGGGLFHAIRTYCVECFSESYYLWIFAGFTLGQLGNLGNQYQFFYLHYDLGLDLDSIGKMRSLPNLVAIALGFAMGSLTDRLKPVRLMAPVSLFWAATNVTSYFLIHDKWTFLIGNGLTTLAIFAYGILYGALIAELFPREKLGQFCSANAISQQLICNGLNIFVGMFFDAIHFNRLGFLWSAFFEAASAVIFIKVYLNWKARSALPPVPRAA